MLDTETSTKRQGNEPDTRRFLQRFVQETHPKYFGDGSLNSLQKEIYRGADKFLARPD
jgi:hypothetical protein